MSFQIVREQRIAYNERGLAGVEDGAYIKIEAALTDWIVRMRGAKLSTFVFISLTEANVCLGRAEAPTAMDISIATGYTKRATNYALRWLEKNEFVAQGEPNKEGYPTYRPKAFAFFGKPRRWETHFPPREKIPSGKSHDMNDEVLNDYSHKESFIHEEGEISRLESESHRIFQKAGIAGKNLILLSERVVPEIAQAWADWLGVVDRKRWTLPEGYCFKQLIGNPSARPPYAAAESGEPVRRERTPKFKISGLLEKKEK
jgi:hypothetical protein